MGANNNALQGRWLSEGNSNSGAIVRDTKQERVNTFCRKWTFLDTLVQMVSVKLKNGNLKCPIIEGYLIQTNSRFAIHYAKFISLVTSNLDLNLKRKR